MKQIALGSIRNKLIFILPVALLLNHFLPALATVFHQGGWSQMASLVVVAFVITLLVYDVVALLVKMDDIGLKLAQRDNSGVKALGW